jgi:hypothetical protein
MLSRLATAKAVGQCIPAPAAVSGSQGAEQGTEATAQTGAIATAHGNSQPGEAATAAAATHGPSGVEVAGAAITTAPAPANMGQGGVEGVAYT